MKNDNNARREALYRAIGEVLPSCTNDKHERAMVAILMCLAAGLNSKAGIIAMLMRLGFNPAHVAMTLKKGRGNDPERHRWRTDGEGRYHVLPQPDVTGPGETAEPAGDDELDPPF